MKYLILMCVYMASMATLGRQWLVLPVNDDDASPAGIVSVRLAPISEDDVDGVPTSVNPIGCQVGLFEHEATMTINLNVDYKLEIVNRTGSSFVFASDDNLDGYFSIELDLRLTNGCMTTMKRKMPAYVSQRLTNIVLQPENRWIAPMSVDRRLWNGMPHDVEQIQEIRPRLKHRYFKQSPLGVSHVGKGGGTTQDASHSEFIGKWIPFKKKDGKDSPRLEKGKL